MSDKGPNWFWRLAELWGVTWPGHARANPAAEIGPLCSACHNPTRRDSRTGEWRCPYHPDALILKDPPGSASS